MTDELAELCLLLRERAGLDVVALTAAGGESRSTFWMTDGAGAVRVLKILRDAPPDRPGSLRALGGVLERLRGRGYPAPAIEAVGHVPGLVYWIQQRMPGFSLDLDGGIADPGTVARLLPGLFRLNDAQAGLGTGDRDEWPDLLARTLTHGGDGYCLHDTLRADPRTREPLRARLLDLAGPRAAGAYLAHMILRQVDWSLRFHPGTPATRRHVRLARLIIADIGG